MKVLSFLTLNLCQHVLDSHVLEKDCDSADDWEHINWVEIGWNRFFPAFSAPDIPGQISIISGRCQKIMELEHRGWCWNKRSAMNLEMELKMSTDVFLHSWRILLWPLMKYCVHVSSLYLRKGIHVIDSAVKFTSLIPGMEFLIYEEIN